MEEINSASSLCDLLQKYKDELYEMGYQLYEANDFSQAKGIFRQLALHYPLSIKYWKALGACLHENCEYQDAIQAWSIWSFLEKQNSGPYLCAAKSFFAIGDLQEGLSSLHAAEIRDASGVHAQEIATLRQCWKGKQ